MDIQNINQYRISVMCLALFIFPIFAHALDVDRPHGIISDNDKTIVTGNSTFTISGGTEAGQNLFHGFSSFHLHKDEQAIFTHGNNINNIIGRISGGETSWINGKITAGANLYLLNPSGFIFGPNTVLDLTGSLLVSTSDRLLFQDHSIFSTSLGQSDTLPDSQPVGVEFTDNSPFSSIIIDNASLKMNANQNLTLIGGDSRPAASVSRDTSFGIKIQRTHIQTNGGDIRLASVSSPGVIRLDSWQVSEKSMDIAGHIGVSNESMIQTGQAETSGNIYIFGGLFYGDDAAFSTASTGHSGNIDIFAKNMVFHNNCRLDSQSYGNGDGGDIHLTITDQLDMSESAIQTNVTANDSGNAGYVEISAKNMVFDNASLIATETSGTGYGGQIRLVAHNNIQIIGGSEILSKAREQASGDAGHIMLNASHIQLHESALISADTDGIGNAGNVTIDATDLSLESQAMVSSSSNSPRQGGQAGKIHILLSNTLSLNGSKTAIETKSAGQGAAGSIDISAQNVFLDHQAHISSTGLGVETYAGDAGTINIHTKNTVRLDNNSELSTSSRFAGGGKIHVASGELLYFSESSINTSVLQGWGSGGDILLETQLMFTTGSIIHAKAENGPGGNIQIHSQQFLEGSGNTISASSRLGIDGRVDILRPTSDISMDVSQLPDQFLDDTARLSDICAARFHKNISVFSLEGRGALPTAYNDWIPGSEITYDRPDIQLQSIPNRSQYLDPLCPFTDDEKKEHPSE
ncbi:MAG: hypothetical protein OMM_06182 [Candidatus Magnetoglobus multicellularis str. Araruama]|uniref:Filamentous haemagglutinin FhaB/tRNA nuclease CdiA-like TPS domain-containing protein n=1 Tax=Candidatus Magnetoglobus multicellularis str. Araruama TaxID=890399 RepID=A0A1V1PIU7_9BACT|nr:MAG: hypothetical protein OMM_06182 [Candidatus Magnetoglobus multicellularis str. Araruama]